MKESRITLLAAAAAGMFATATATAQNFLETFDDGNDDGWTHFNPFNGTYTFPNGAYRMYVPAATDSSYQTYIGSVGPSRTRVHENFTISVDVLAQPARIGVGSFLTFRGDDQGIGDGYGLILYVRPSGGSTVASIIFNRFDAFNGVHLASSPTVTISDGARLRLTVRGSGSDFVGYMHDLNDLSTPLTSVNASDGVYTSGVTGLWLAFFVGAPNSEKEATFDNLRVVGCRADYNADGQADFFDYLDFVQAYAEDDASADFNFDGQVDFFDYLDFVAAFAEGC